MICNLSVVTVVEKSLFMLLGLFMISHMRCFNDCYYCHVSPQSLTSINLKVQTEGRDQILKSLSRQLVSQSLGLLSEALYNTLKDSGIYT